MKCRICIILILVCHFSLGQNNYSDIVKPKLSFVSNKAEATDTTKFVVLDNDTLYVKYDKYDDLSFLNSASKEDKKNLIDYESIIFQYTDENSKKPMILKQWNCPIVLYLDKNIPKNVRKCFTSFFSQIDGIENLSVSFTKNINDSNYLIKLVDEPVNGYGDDFEFENEEEKNNYIFTGSLKFEFKTSKYLLVFQRSKFKIFSIK